MNRMPGAMGALPGDGVLGLAVCSNVFRLTGLSLLVLNARRRWHALERECIHLSFFRALVGSQEWRWGGGGGAGELWHVRVDLALAGCQKQYHRTDFACLIWRTMCWKSQAGHVGLACLISNSYMRSIGGWCPGRPHPL